MGPAWSPGTQKPLSLSELSFHISQKRNLDQTESSIFLKQRTLPTLLSK